MRLSSLVALLSLGLTGCALSNGQQQSIRIALPQDSGASTSLSESLVSIANGYGGSAIINVPATVNAFQCYGLNITGPGIPPHPGGPDCVKRDSDTPYLGQAVGLVPSTDGYIDADVLAGPNRLIQLFGMTSDIGCPSLRDLIDNKIHTDNHMGQPYEIGRAITDIFDDSQVVIKTHFDPAQPNPMVCDQFTGENPGVPHIEIDGIGTRPGGVLAVPASGCYPHLRISVLDANNQPMTPSSSIPVTFSNDSGSSTVSLDISACASASSEISTSLTSDTTPIGVNIFDVSPFILSISAPGWATLPLKLVPVTNSLVFTATPGAAGSYSEKLVISVSGTDPAFFANAKVLLSAVNPFGASTVKFYTDVSGGQLLDFDPVLNGVPVILSNSASPSATVYAIATQSENDDITVQDASIDNPRLVPDQQSPGFY